MNTREACDLAVDLTRQLAVARAEAESFRRLAKQAIHHIHEQQAEAAKLRARYLRLVEEFRSYRASTIATSSEWAA